MKRLFEIITAFLCINSVTPVLMYYIYDDSPNVGFVGGIDNGVGAFVPGYNPTKKQFTGSYGPRFQKYTNEHVVDSHFKVMKSPSRYSMPAMDKNNGQRGNDYTATEAANAWRQNTVQGRNAGNLPQQLLPKERNLPKSIISKIPKDTYGPDSRSPDGQQPKVVKSVSNIPPIRPKAVNAEYTSPIKQQRARSQNEIFEPKPNFVQMNVRKTQISQDPQKILRLNNNRQLTAASVHGTQSNRQRVPTSMMMDKTLHKTNGLNDRNLQTMSRVLDDMTQQLTDRRQKGEYRKRDIKKTLDFYEKPKRNPISDNMRKYIGKDKSVIKERKERKTNMEVARIGSHEESLETSDAPYALFYRMNPESLDQQEAFILMRSMEANASNEFTSKEKRGSDKFDLKKTSARKAKTVSSALTLHKKMRNFSNFRSK